MPRYHFYAPPICSQNGHGLDSTGRHIAHLMLIHSLLPTAPSGHNDLYAQCRICGGHYLLSGKWRCRHSDILYGACMICRTKIFAIRGLGSNAFPRLFLNDFTALLVRLMRSSIVYFDSALPEAIAAISYHRLIRYFHYRLFSFSCYRLYWDFHIFAAWPATPFASTQCTRLEIMISGFINKYNEQTGPQSKNARRLL